MRQSALIEDPDIAVERWWVSVKPCRSGSMGFGQGLKLACSTVLRRTRCVVRSSVLTFYERVDLEEHYLFEGEGLRVFRDEGVVQRHAVRWRRAMVGKDYDAPELLSIENSIYTESLYYKEGNDTAG